jgi:hypothetical protein
MAVDLDNTIRGNAQGPTNVAVDRGTVEQRKLSRQKALHPYLSAV